MSFNKGTKIDFFLERSFWWIIVKVKRILTRLGLRNSQSCKRCGRNTTFTFNVDDKIWSKLPKKYHNKVLCFDCFIDEYPEEFDLKEIKEYFITKD